MKHNMYSVICVGIIGFAPAALQGMQQEQVPVYQKYENIVTPEQQKTWRQTALTFLMGHHSRVGVCSPLQSVAPDVMRTIANFAAPYAGFKRIFVRVTDLMNKKEPLHVSLPWLDTFVTYKDLKGSLQQVYPADYSHRDQLNLNNGLENIAIRMSTEDNPLEVKFVKRFFRL